MRTTITLEEDVAARIQAEARRSGHSFKDTVNATLRAGLDARRARRSVAPFKVTARSLGALSPGLRLDNIAELLETIDGPLGR